MSYRYATPVRELQRRISSAEFAELWAEETLEPRGVQRLAIEFARFMSLFANAHREKGGKSYKPEDLISRFGPQEPRVMTGEEMAAWARAFTVAMGGKVVERGDDRQPGN